MQISLSFNIISVERRYFFYYKITVSSNYTNLHTKYKIAIAIHSGKDFRNSSASNEIYRFNNMLLNTPYNDFDLKKD